jgi:23S rRNA (guanosine2251-2'-O)-methyltransferase
MAGEPRADSSEYQQKKSYFEQFLTLYGRKAVLEAVESPVAQVARVHIAGDTRSGILRKIVTAAEEQGAEIIPGTKEQVARISKHGRQDQGVAADVRLSSYGRAEDYLQAPPKRFALLGVDGMTTPANLGMTIRSATAAGIDGIVIPRRRVCDIGPMVVKASAGTIFQSTLLRCDRLEDAVETARSTGAETCLLDSRGQTSLFEYDPPERVFYVVGGETAGAAREVRSVCDRTLSVPLHNGVESLNAAVSAALVAYRNLLSGGPNGSR